MPQPQPGEGELYSKIVAPIQEEEKL